MKIDFFRTDDWEVIFIDNIKRVENHKIDIVTLFDVLRQLNSPVIGEVNAYWIDDEKMEEVKYSLDIEDFLRVSMKCLEGPGPAIFLT